MSNINPSTVEYDTIVTADQKVPAVHIERIFAATPAQLFRAHTDPVLVAQWLGPRDLEMTVDTWDCRSGGEYHYTHRRVGENGPEEYGFRGCFHEVSPTKLVQTFTFEGFPEGVALETMTFEDLGDGRTKLHAFSLVDSFEGRDQFLASGMETGVNEGYQRLDELIAAGALSIPIEPSERHRSIAATFAAVVSGVTDWNAPTPVAEWCAIDVVNHLVEWPVGFFAAGGVELAPTSGDPVARWDQHAAAIQALLDGPDRDAQFTHPMAGSFPLATAIDMFYTSDVFMHTWDLARSCGHHDGLDADEAARLLEGMLPIDAMLRQSGQYGPRIAVTDDAPPQDQLMAFVGRDPAWRPAT